MRHCSYCKIREATFVASRDIIEQANHNPQSAAIVEGRSFCGSDCMIDAITAEFNPSVAYGSVVVCAEYTSYGFDYSYARIKEYLSDPNTISAHIEMYRWSARRKKWIRTQSRKVR